MIFRGWLGYGWQLGLVGSLGLVGALIGGGSDPVFAQIKPDATLGNERSRVTLGASYQIKGGATRGTNLFHSFQQFNVGKGQEVFFDNNASDIKNIISRVTGSSGSKIQGTLGVKGAANLFLINPNGIVFGPSARLDLKGSFVATTASAIQFDDQGFFSASEPDALPVLTVNPSAFLFNQIAAQPIINRSVAPYPDDESSVDGLRVPDGQSLLLVGGDIRLEGGLVRAQGGRVELGGIAETGTVKLDDNLDLSFPQGVERADVFLSNEAAVSTSGAGGNVELEGRRITLTDGSQIRANTSGSEPGGSLTVNASDSVKLSGTTEKGLPGGLFTQAQEGSGAAGDLKIKTGKLTVQKGAQVSASTVGEGQGGRLDVNASSIKLSGTSANESWPSGLFTQAEEGSSGAAGDLKIKTGKLIVQKGAVVSTSTVGEGQGGRLDVNASSIKLSGTSANKSRPSGLFVGTGGAADAGDLKIQTEQLTIQGGAQISAPTLGKGQGGTLTVDASSVKLSGTNGKARSGLFVGTDGPGAAGDLKIQTEQLTIQNGARVSASTSKESTENGGSIIINTGELNVLKGADVTVSSLGSGDAGNLKVTARSILLNNEGNLRATTESGKGGNITINADTLVGIKNSDIRADANEGEGGFIDITAQGIFGLKVREQLTKNSDITAFSQKDPSLSGVVEINTPDTDPSEGIVTLPEGVIDVSGLVAQSCPVGGGAGKRAASKFVVTGRGGLPPSPSDSLDTDAVQVDLVTLKPEVNKPYTAAVSTSSTNPVSVPIVEAQGWVRGPGGEIVLTAQAPTVTPHPGLAPASCRGP